VSTPAVVTSIVSEELYPTFESWTERIQFLLGIDSRFRWELGDALVAGEKLWGEGKAYSKAQEILRDYDRDSLRNIANVARSVPASFRNDALSFTHHKHVAPLDPEKQKYWLDRAFREHLSTGDLKRLIELEKQEEARAEQAAIAADIRAKAVKRYGSEEAYNAEQARYEAIEKQETEAEKKRAIEFRKNQPKVLKVKLSKLNYAILRELASKFNMKPGEFFLHCASSYLQLHNDVFADEIKTARMRAEKEAVAA
jgi:hypothetical protein